MIEIINIILNNNDLIYFLIKYNIEKKEILKSISEEKFRGYRKRNFKINKEGKFRGYTYKIKKEFFKKRRL